MSNQLLLNLISQSIKEKLIKVETEP